MRSRTLYSIIGIAIALGAARNATAQCPCDCYFSGDCETGNFCNWGVLSQEDSCFWKTPKPQGNVGVGCEDEYGSFGQCDGICSPSGPPSPPDVTEDDIEVIRLWRDAFNAVSLSGGGTISRQYVQRIQNVGLDSVAADDLGKIVVELLLVTRGSEFVTFPTRTGFRTEELTVAGIERGCRFDAGNTLVDAFISELETPYSGGTVLAKLDSTCLDTGTLDRICAGEAPNACLYQRVVDMLGYFNARVSQRVLAGGDGGEPCATDQPLAPPTVEAVGSRHIAITPDPENDDEVALMITTDRWPCMTRFVRYNGTLSTSPVYRAAADWGTIVVRSADIHPDTAYSVVVDDGDEVSEPSPVSTWRWGDTNGDDMVDLADIFCSFDSYTGQDAACTMWGADLMYDDGQISMDDIMASLDAFAGYAYEGDEPCE
jgi:hypothetical protein